MDENLKSRPWVKEKVLGMFKVKEEPKKAPMDPSQYESGLEVVRPLSWNLNDVPLPEVSPYPHLDAKTLSTPQVDNDPATWNHYHLKNNPGLEVASLSTSTMSPGGYSSTLYRRSQDGGAASAGLSSPGDDVVEIQGRGWVRDGA